MFLVRFAPPSMTTAQYEEVKHRVSEEGGFPPEGLEMHVCFGDEGARRVTEVWASMDEFHRFGERLMPAIEAAGLAVSEPEILPVRTFFLADDPQAPDDTGLVVRWQPQSLSMEQYEQVSAKVDEHGDPMLDGALVHVCMGEDGALQVGEAWRSAQAFDDYLAWLRPLLEEAGISPTDPERFPQHSLVVTEDARRHVTV